MDGILYCPVSLIDALFLAIALQVDLHLFHPVFGAIAYCIVVRNNFPDKLHLVLQGQLIQNRVLLN